MKPKSRKTPARPHKTQKLSALGELKRAVGRVVERAAERSRNAGESATQLLIEQHDEVKALFKKIESASSRAEKVEFFEELAANLVAHDAIEREIFYPACEREMGMTDLLGEALVEHGVVEFGLFQADNARRSADFDYKVQVLSELVLHHVKEEEDEFLPKAEKELGKAKLLELGAQMKAHFQKAKALDFRPPLHSNLSQVLEGALKPAKRGGATRESSKAKVSGSVRSKSSSARAPKSTKRRRAAA
jgi:hypothetical protein